VSSRRAVFFDVENSNRTKDVELVLRYLGLPTGDDTATLWAIGNWRVVSYETARMLSGCGAILVHSAPAFGVKDWTDLRIAAAAGIWLGDACPLDTIDVVSDDRAFDAIGDLAVRHGVAFRRLSARLLIGSRTVPRPPPRGRPGGRRRRHGRPDRASTR
jgi:hypothetical protein